MKAIKTLIFLSLCFGSIAVTAADLKKARPESVGMSSDRLERIRPIMQEYVDQNQLAGITTMISRRGKIVHHETVGKLNLTSGEALQADSLFRIYSMTKPIVSVALMQLYEQGKFQLDDPVANYLPAFKDVEVLVDGERVKAKHAPTIREVMSHTAGFTYGIFGNSEVDKLYKTALYRPKSMGMEVKNLDEMVEKMGALPLLYQPGERWVYSLSADVVGKLIEVLSGQPLDVYLRQELFAPLAMNDTFFEVPKSKLHRFGTNHIRNKLGELIVIDSPETSRYGKKVTFFSGGGGLVGSTMDYMRFAQMLLNGGTLDGKRILSPRTIELMTTNQLDEGVKSGFGERPGVAGTFGFGLGFGIATEKPKTVSGSKGEYTWGGAAGTIFWVDPKEELVGVLMVQMMRNPIGLRQQFKVLTHQAIVD
jgi:CubicO group peptidase (beta-lactamase class C family)